MAFLLLINDLLCRKGGEGLRIPVHHAQTTVDKTLVIEVDEDFDHTLATSFVHCEGGAVPVAGCTQTAQLLQDDASVLMSPVPGML